MYINHIGPSEVTAQAINNGTLHARKGINFPDTHFNIDTITPQDKPYIQLCLDHNIDFIALSFVQSATDIIQLRNIIKASKKSCKIIAKIERPNAVKNIASIIQASDAIMIARGDLGIEADVRWVPIIQKRIINQCRQASKPVITATQMLESLTHSQAQPTRAECADIANAVLDGTDAVMLSVETANASYPARNVKIMSSICEITESADEKPRLLSYQLPNDKEKHSIEALAYSSVEIAKKSTRLGLLQ